MKEAVTTIKEGLCFICSEEAEDVIGNVTIYFNVYCHKDCWNQACCNLIEFPEERISDEQFQKLTGVDISYVCYVYSDGTKSWFVDGKLHREGGPAVECADGSKEWHLDGKCHREDGPAWERADGTKEWYKHSKCHREGGPAVERMDGTKEWRLHGKLHREDGPAIERMNRAKKWYLDGNHFSEQDHAEEMKRQRR